MLSTYWTIAVRRLRRAAGFSVLNIVGLAAGLAVCLLILLYVQDELQFDRWNPNAGRLYRIDNQLRLGDTRLTVAQSAPAVGPAFKRDFPQVEQVLRFRNRGGFVVARGAESFRENKVIYVDSTLFDVFPLPLVAGDAHKALTAPNSVVITEAIARKYFHRTDVVGESLLMNGTTDFQVTGVIRRVPPQSHFDYDFFVAMAGVAQSRDDNWISQNFNTYVVLKPGVDARQMEAAFSNSMEGHTAPELEKFLHLDAAGLKKSGSFFRCSLMPVTKIHLYAHEPGELGANGSIQYVYIFSAIAIFILIIACVNFMNLSTARAAERAREVGVRKVLGSQRRSLIIQFLVESVLLSFLSLLLAIGATALLLPLLDQLSLKSISLGDLFSARMMGYAAAGMLIVGLLAGIYPAFILSGFRPVEVLKGQTAPGLGTSWLRSALVVFQFTISVMLVIGTVVVFSQLSYLLHMDIGYDKDQLLVIRNTYLLKEHARGFRDELSQLPGVRHATMTGFLPVDGDRSNDVFFPNASLDPHRGISMQKWGVDAEYVSTLGIQMIKGRNFSTMLPTDSGCFIINEAAAALLDKGDPLQQSVYEVEDSGTVRYPILGVFKNFNFNSPHETITPLALQLRRENGSITLRVVTKDIPHLVAQVQNKWKRAAPSQPFDYAFLDDSFAAQFAAEQRIGVLSVTFSVLAILIACLGLFGLVTYATVQRRKEIGVRKVLGAGLADILVLLSKDFIRLVAIGILIASPLSLWLMKRWLQDFAYRVPLNAWIFVGAGLTGLLIAAGTIAGQAFRAARTNPAETLRTE